MYNVVTNKKKEYYIVCTKWMGTIKGQDAVFAFYPPPKIHDQCLKKNMDANDDWKYEEVVVKLHNTPDLAEANRYITEHTKHADTESSECEQQKKVIKRKHPVSSLLDLDFNTELDNEITRAVEDILPSTSEDRIEAANEKQFEHELIPNSTETNFDDPVSNEFSTPLGRDEDYGINNSASDNFYMQAVHVNMIYEMKKDIQSLRSEQINMIKIQKDFFNAVQQELKQINQKIASLGNGNICGNNMKRPQRINSLELFDKIEKKIELMDEEFCVEYNQLVWWFSSNVSSPSHAFSKTNGLVAGFLKMYFDDNFVKMIGWSSKKGRIPFEKYKGHLKLVFDICNTNTPKLFSNIDQCGDSCHEFFKRLHSAKRPKKANEESVETLDQEDIEI